MIWVRIRSMCSCPSGAKTWNVRQTPWILKASKLEEAIQNEERTNSGNARELRCWTSFPAWCVELLQIHGWFMWVHIGRIHVMDSPSIIFRLHQWFCRLLKIYIYIYTHTDFMDGNHGYCTECRSDLVVYTRSLLTLTITWTWTLP